MKNLAIARRYAKALLLIGKEDGQTETYREELKSFSEIPSPCSRITLKAMIGRERKYIFLFLGLT